MPTPVPSPKGTNLERLYFTKQPIALDAAPDADGNARITALATLVAQLDDDEKAMLLRMLQPDASSADPDDDPAMDGGPTWADREFQAGRMSASEYVSSKKYHGGRNPRTVMDQMIKLDPDYGKTFFERFPQFNRLKY